MNNNNNNHQFRLSQFKKTKTEQEYIDERQEKFEKQRNDQKRSSLLDKRKKLSITTQQESLDKSQLIQLVSRLKLDIASSYNVDKDTKFRILVSLRNLVSREMSLDQTILLTQLIIDDYISSNSLKKNVKDEDIHMDDEKSVENTKSIWSFVIECLRNSNAGLRFQLESAWCITNMACGNEAQCKFLLESSCYLVQYLGSGHKVLQDQCAWALGNIAMDSIEIRDSLLRQGIIPSLVKLLASDTKSLLDSTCFCMSSLLKLPIVNVKLHKLIHSHLLSILNLLNYQLSHSKDSEIIFNHLWLLCDIFRNCKLSYLPLTTEYLPKDISVILSTISIMNNNNIWNTSIALPCIRILGTLVTDESIFSNYILPNTKQIDHLIKPILEILNNIQLEYSKISTKSIITIVKESLYYLSNLIYYDNSNNNNSLTNILIQSQYINQLFLMKLNDIFSTSLCSDQCIQIELIQLLYNIYCKDSTILLKQPYWTLVLDLFKEYSDKSTIEKHQHIEDLGLENVQKLTNNLLTHVNSINLK
ncbi:hypothetical protein DLAC_04271 [Tieghemostelium lacteum]|uniref:Importin subunit alpha n=1 Tax=Tieghemostelium lacteum TaxID=361077 RepID=A0A151ZSN3_TIELA|nr:hypothetical protein DLAC_04271 [Tieghemostelium lacteum]|eukprot:KYQ96949.1 hypothetical protein DLAC_04271 [Tieghemostelium lacteum]